MSFWKIDLTTEDGAANAAATGGTACFIAGGLTLLGAVFVAGAVRMGSQAPIVLGLAAVSIVIYLSAGIRLRGGKGVFWGSTAVALLAVELLTKLAMLSLFGLLFLEQGNALLQALWLGCILVGLLLRDLSRLHHFFQN